MGEITVSDDISALKVEDINELSQNREVLEGLWESSEGGEAIFNEQLVKANANIERGRDVAAKAAAVRALRDEVSELAGQHEAKFAEWEAAQAEMLSAIEPFTTPRLAARLAADRDECRALSESLRTAILEGSTTVPAFVKQYQAAQVKLRRYEHMMAALK